MVGVVGQRKCKITGKLKKGSGKVVILQDTEEKVRRGPRKSSKESLVV